VKRTLRKTFAGLGLLCAWAAALGASAVTRADEGPLELKLANGRFEPAQLVVPANTPFKVKVTNASDAAIEFESFELNRERVVPPGESATVNFPSLDSGTYKFFDDFNSNTAPGEIVVR
jgi:heme/copper-type cytochrome/quinol oxidase subunit 2